MSTYYIPRDKISFNEIKGIKELIYEIVTENTNDNRCCLTDGKSYLWVSRSSKGFSTFERYGRQSTVDDIITFIEKKWDTELISEHNDDFEELSDLDEYSSSYIKIILGEGKNE